MASLDDQAQQQITGFWDTVAPGYDGHPGNVPSAASGEFEAWVAAVNRLLPPPPADVLDIATGTGFVALIAAASGRRVTAIDGSRAMLSEAEKGARRRDVDVTFALADGVDPDLTPESFDAIISRHFIWTLREPERAFGKWLRLLRPGGVLIAIDCFWFDQRLGEEAAGDDPAGLFEQYYTAETRAALPVLRFASVEPIAAMLGSAGFEHVSVSDLADVHAVAEHPPSAEPWYVLTARRPG